MTSLFHIIKGSGSLRSRYLCCNNALRAYAAIWFHLALPTGTWGTRETDKNVPKFMLPVLLGNHVSCFWPGSCVFCLPPWKRGKLTCSLANGIKSQTLHCCWWESEAKAGILIQNQMLWSWQHSKYLQSGAFPKGSFLNVWSVHAHIHTHTHTHTHTHRAKF